jgi:glycosyltransferase involved in cell wall biosynthesis
METPGVVAARNEGVKQSRGEIIIFIDDDVEIEDPYFLLKHAINYLDPDIDAVTGRELYPVHKSIYRLSVSKPEQHIDSKITDTSWKMHSGLKQVLGFARESEYRAEVCTLSTCNCSIRKAAFLRYGGFDENFRGNSYGDDYDLALRMAAGNARIIYDPEPWLIHLKSPIGGLRLSDQANVFSEREKAVCLFIFLFRHGARGYYLNLLWNHVIRKTVFLRRNVMEPWRQPKVWWGLLSAIPEAVKAVNHGPISRFAN